MEIERIKNIESRNNRSKNSVTEMPPMGYFVSHAKRNPKIPFLVRGNSDYSLRWDVVDSAFLQQANVAFFQILLFAADIVHWFKRLCLPLQYLTTTLDTVRTDFLVLPARLVREHKKNIVKLPHDYHHQKEFLAALQKIETLRLPNKFRFCK